VALFRLSSNSCSSRLVNILSLSAASRDATLVPHIQPYRASDSAEAESLPVIGKDKQSVKLACSHFLKAFSRSDVASMREEIKTLIQRHVDVEMRHKGAESAVDATGGDD